MKPITKRINRRLRRKKHVRKRVIGTPERPRLTVFRSNKNIYAQIIDDEAGKTLVDSSTVRKDVAPDLGASPGGRAAAKIVGQAIASRAVEQGIKKVVFDRNGYQFHGRVQELADAAREGGLEF